MNYFPVISAALNPRAFLRGAVVIFNTDSILGALRAFQLPSIGAIDPDEGCTSSLCRAACRYYAGTIPCLPLQGTMERQEKYRSEASLLS